MTEQRRFINSLIFPTFMLFLMWVVKIVEVVTSDNFVHFGIYPMKISGLLGIFTSPLIHSNFDHLFSNSIPFLVLGVGIFYFYIKVRFQIFFLIYFFEGISVWLIGRESYHIGASGLVYGFAAFLFFSGIFNRNRQLLAISLLVIFLYGGMVWGVLPLKEEISWESHFMGAVGGTFFAFVFRKHLPFNQLIPSTEDKDFTCFHATDNTRKIIYIYKKKIESKR